MTAHALFGFLTYAFVNAFTPGPGNILALNTATVYGWKGGKPLFIGIFAGYFAVQTICGLFVFGRGEILPSILGVLKYVGAAYIVWLAVHIAASKPQADGSSETAAFSRGFLLQFVNVKIYFFGITALTGFITPWSSNLAPLMAAEFFIAGIGCIATLTWIGSGVALQRVYQAHYRPINFVLAATLIVCAASMLLS